MKIQLLAANRHVTAQRVPRLSIPALTDDLLRGRAVQGDFVHFATRVPAFDQTRFRVVTDGEDILVAAEIVNTLRPLSAGDSIEMFFDPFHDHLGFFQFIFPFRGEPMMFHHLPYGDALSTRFRYVELKSHAWGAKERRNVVNVKELDHYVFARFAVADVMRAGNACGFNVCRYRADLKEASSWNLCSGNGLVDATSFGHLHIGDPPVIVTIDDATLEPDAVSLRGTVSRDVKSFELTLADPLDARVSADVRADGGAWSVRLALPRAVGGGWDHQPGRYRVYPRVGGRSHEPEFFVFDRPLAASRGVVGGRGSRPPSSFSVGMYYDVPDDLRGSHFTAGRLASEIGTLREWGVDRLYWIDYGPTNKSRTFWEWASDWKNASRSHKEAGDLLHAAAREAKARGMTFFGTFKPFDMGFSEPEFDKRGRGLVKEVENRWSCVLDEVAANQDATMRANPAWVRAIEFPVTKLRFVSDRSIVAVKAKDIELFVSDDNRKYRPYRGKFTVKQSSGAEPDARWTPVGAVPDATKRKVWSLELSGLRVKEKYVAIRVNKAGFEMINPMFSLCEATDSRGHPAEHWLSTRGGLDAATGVKGVPGFWFSKEWPGWANATPKLVSRYAWKGDALGIALVPWEGLPQTLDPLHPASREVWLSYVRRIIDAGCDGVDIRILCQHHCCPMWLKYVYSEPALRAFESRFGRPPEATEADYRAMRILRGEAMTQFLRDAKAITSEAGKKLCVHGECGIEVPVDLHTRMELHLDWERWIGEGIVDEVMLKYWGSQNKFVHERLLPLARKHRVPVHICDMNFTLQVPTGIERAGVLAGDALAAGFAGYAFYETHSYLQMTSLGLPRVVAHADKAVRRAADTVRAMLGENGASS